ncbi:hypothetical protein NMG60_11009583 [Bertholletia excelsa]
MAGGRVGYCGRDSKMSSALLRNLKVPCPSQQFDSPFLPGPSSSFLGKRSIVSFADVDKGNRWDRSFFRSFDQEENVDDEWDEYFQQTEKKRRLTADQIQFLERSFEADNKLEPERKIQLAKELGLQPRQIAIWFQNRRARWKTKQLEKDYEALQASYDGLKANYDGLLKEKEKLKAQVLLLTDQLLLGQKEKESVESSVNKEQYGGPLQEPVVDSISEVKYQSIQSWLMSRKIYARPKLTNWVQFQTAHAILMWAIPLLYNWLIPCMFLSLTIRIYLKTKKIASAKVSLLLCPTCSQKLKILIALTRPQISLDIQRKITPSGFGLTDVLLAHVLFLSCKCLVACLF